MGPLLTDYNVSAPRELLKVGGKFWFTNFAQPLRDACEPPPGKPHDCCWHLGCILRKSASNYRADRGDWPGLKHGWHQLAAGFRCEPQHTTSAEPAA